MPILEREKLQLGKCKKEKLGKIFFNFKNFKISYGNSILD
jgi:hypothetical protein